MEENESQLRDTGQHAHATLTSTPGLVDKGIAVITDDGIIQHANDAFGALVGDGSADLRGTAIGTLLTPVAEGTDSAGNREIPALFADGTDELQVEHDTETGRDRPLRLTATRANDRWVCVCQETTTAQQDDTRQHHAAPRTEATGHDQQTLEAIGDPVYVLDSTGTIQQVNEAMLTFTGYERGELVGRDIGEVVPATRAEYLADRLATPADDDRQTLTVEAELLTSGGAVALTEVTVTVQRDPDGSYTGSTVVVRDIRERKRRQRDLELLKQVLTRVFRHNVRNELTVTQSYAELLAERVDPELRRHAETILDAAERLLSHSEKARLIEDVIETEEHTEVELGAAVERTIETVTTEYPEATVDAKLPDNTAVRAHPQVSSAIEEVLVNAFEHAPAGSEPTVEIWVDEGPELVTLFVEDESGGLAAHELQVLRAGRESSLEHTSGVGLWLIRLFAEASGADLIVHRTDEGTVVGIQFRSADTEADRQPYSPVDSPFIQAPDDVREVTPEQFRGDTVVGRASARQQLEEIYEDLPRTGGHSVVVTGEAGIGKTTLVEQFRAELEQADERPLVATGLCEQDSQSPYRPFEAVIDDLPVEQSFEEIRETAGSFDASDTDEVQQRKQAMFADIADQFREVVTEQPTVVIVEDMHWADSGTIDLFEFLVDELGRWSHPILFLCTYRTSGVEESHPVLDIAADADEMGRGTVVELEPFGPSDVEALLASLFGVEKLPDSFVQAVHAHTGGTPLFVSELGSHFLSELGPVEHGEQLPATLDEMTVPETVQQAIDQRLDALPSAATPVLEAGAVLGETFSFDVLREASGQSVDSLIEAVDTLVRREVWTRSGESIEFAHGVVRDQVRNRMEPATERTLHERAAEAIETIHADDLDAHAGRLAAHYERTGDHETAFGYYRREGARASDSFANDEAITAYEQALALADEQTVGTDEEIASACAALGEVYSIVGDLEAAEESVDAGLAVAPQDSGARCRLLGERAAILETHGDYEKATETLEHKRELAASLGRQSLEAGALNALGGIALIEADYDRARECYERSLDICEAIDDRKRTANSLKSLGVIAGIRGASEQAQQYFERSRAIYEEIGSRRGRAQSLNNLGGITERSGDYEQAQQYHQRSLAIKEEIGDRRGQAISLHNLGNVSVKLGNLEQAREYYERSLTISDEIGDRRGKANSFDALGSIDIRRGDYEQARKYYERSLEINADNGERSSQAVSLRNLGVVARHRGNYQRAREYYECSLAISKEIGERRDQAPSLCYLGIVAQHRGDYDRSKEYYERSLAISEEIGTQPRQVEVLPRIAALARLRRDIEAARAALDRTSDILADINRPAYATIYHRQCAALARVEGKFELAQTHLDDGLTVCDEITDTQRELKIHLERTRLALCRDDPVQARAALERAHSLLAGTDTSLEAGRASLLQGRIAAETGEREAAREQFREALAVFDDIGATADTLRTLEHLTSAARKAGDTDQACEWCRQASDRLADASDALAESHREWVDRHASALGVTDTDEPSS